MTKLSLIWQWVRFTTCAAVEGVLAWWMEVAYAFQEMMKRWRK